MNVTTTIELDKGEPDTSMIPYDLVIKATEEIFADENGRNQGTYWGYPCYAGNIEFRQHIADFLRQTCSVSTLTFENIFITNGVSAILDQLCTMFLRAGDTVLVECPTYLYTLDLFRDHHVHIVSCSTDEDGLILDSTFVTDILERKKPKMIYLIPTFQNPAGFTMSHERREQLVKLSVKYNFIIVADEVYHLLNYDKNDHPKTFASYHNERTVIALHSFSKVLPPSLRLGFACAHQELVHAMSQYGMIESGGGASPFVSGIVDRILVQGLLKKFLDEKLCVEYSKRMQVLHDELMKTFSNENITCRQPSGGYFLWVKFNDTTVDCDQLLIIAQKHGVKFQPGRLFAHSTKAKAELVNYLRLSISITDCDGLKEACARLKQAFEEYKNTSIE
ncbi:unnamed protein product [Adineta steineri]|uniref:Aminotransferase class I/classII large domain-containing protein n=1 Tax=Adineta steineri TaxID=433720 RepID=A0A818L5M8_9BILA|nr:unnamed protein product [Adineta steineri]